jgi:diguanylate cyclase (GGDEF)-like protein
VFLPLYLGIAIYLLWGDTLAVRSYFSDIWSATQFRDAALDSYAERQIRKDTRQGVQIMAALSLLVNIVVWLWVASQSTNSLTLYSHVVLAILSLHVLISARFVDDVRALHGLGMVLLIVSALAITFIAHRTSTLSIGMMAAIIMLFISIPLIPWALREAAIVVGLTILLLTSSLISIPGRFNLEAIWLLQLLVFGSTLIVAILVARNTAVRKQDMQARFELDNARKEMELLSLKDPLTGAWNRRYLDSHFPKMAQKCRDKGKALHVAVLDIDDFKGINDTYGHQLADQILESLGAVFSEQLGDEGSFIRLGGDEFLILPCNDDLEALISRAVAALHDKPAARTIAARREISLSAGFASAGPTEDASPEKLYMMADKALYSMKRERQPKRMIVDLDDTFNRTGKWKV